MLLDKPLIETLPPPDQIEGRLADTLRELRLLRRMLRLAELAEEYRECDRVAAVHVRKRWSPKRGSDQ
jgi:hypothetical protein